MRPATAGSPVPLAPPRLVWRLARTSHARDLDGEGSRLYGGRWNSPGVAVVYTSATLSLAALELFVHLDPDTVPEDLVAVAVEIPARITGEEIALSSLPRSWRSYPAPPALARLGAGWVQRAESPVLAVPSVIIPRERNYLLNPAHRDFSRLAIHSAEAFSFDPRMWKLGR